MSSEDLFAILSNSVNTFEIPFTEKDEEDKWRDCSFTGCFVTTSQLKTFLLDHKKENDSPNFVELLNETIRTCLNDYDHIVSDNFIISSEDDISEQGLVILNLVQIAAVAIYLRKSCKDVYLPNAESSFWIADSNEDDSSICFVKHGIPSFRPCSDRSNSTKRASIVNPTDFLSCCKLDRKAWIYLSTVDNLNDDGSDFGPQVNSWEQNVISPKKDKFPFILIARPSFAKLESIV
ncbi:MAG: hypothetical protein HRT90_03540 [Candidatus Margulisbacteria bacterium]|nr:hypothetical protein [Candidatus Margulisiibacteriota bacterium]